MKIARILIAGVAVMILNVVIGAVCCGKIFNWVYKIEPTNVWKAMDGPPGATFLVGTLVLSVILAIVYAVLNKGIPGKGKISKGLMFGLVVWLVGTLPGMLATYAFMTVATTVVIYWTILGLVTYLLKGIIIAAICGE